MRQSILRFILAKSCVLTVFLLWGTPSLADPCSSMKIMTFNIRYGNKSDTDANAWLYKKNPRRQRVINTLQQNPSDLIGLQEVLDFQLDDISKALPDYAVWGVGRDDGKRRGEAVPLYYKRDRFELIEAGHFWLSETPEKVGTVFAGSGSIRMASWIRLKDQLCDKTLLALNTHWDNVSSDSRIRSAQLIQKRLIDLAQGSDVLVLGDFNSTEKNPAVSSLLGGAQSVLPLHDAYRSVHPLQEPNELTFHDFSGRIQGERIDFILTSQAWQTQKAEINRQSFDGLYPSDHYPVAVEVER